MTFEELVSLRKISMNKAKELIELAQVSKHWKSLIEVIKTLKSLFVSITFVLIDKTSQKCQLKTDSLYIIFKPLITLRLILFM